MKRVYRIADLFCGAGGTSTGAVEAAREAGFKVELTAINHWPVAVATHTANHPEARHLCTSVDDVNPRSLFQMGQLDLLWASPECTHHSRARGGKPMNDQSRATGHCVVRWAEALQPPVILVENVPEFLDWGPIGTNGKPLVSKKGTTFRAWVGMLESLGYKVEWQILCAADFGDATTRQRLFIQAVRGRRRIQWPERTHVPAAMLAQMLEQGELFDRAHLKPWKAAREIIDWTVEGRWLDEMPGKAQHDGLPLSPKTLKRIHAGLRKYGVKPFVTNRGEDLVRPFLVQLRGTKPEQIEGSGQSLDNPMNSITAGGKHHGLVEPFIVPIDHTGAGAVRVNSIHDPLTTVTTEARHCVVEPYLIEVAHGDGNGRGNSGRQKSIDEPVGSLPCSNRFGLLEPFIVPVGFGEREGQAPRCHSVNAPMPTVVGTVKHAVIEPHLLPQHSGGQLRPVSQPVPTIATAGAIAFVEPFLVKYNGTAGAQSVADPLDTVTTKDRFGLVCPEVEIEGQLYRVRLRWRMLQPHELAAAHSFPKDYQFTGTKSDAVKQVGNSVPRKLARALVRAALERRAV